MKRRVAIAFLAVVLLLVAASLALLRTAWAGREICALLSSRVRAATGEPLAFAACRVDPLRLSVEARGVRLGRPEAPLFQADAVRARLAAVQAMGGALEVAELEVFRPRLTLTVPPSDPRSPPPKCPPAALSQVVVRRLQVVDGALDLSFPEGPRLRVARLNVRAAPGSAARGLRALASPTRRAALTVELADAEVALRDRTLRVDAARADVDLALDLSYLEVADAWAEGGGARLGLKGSVENLCRPALDLHATARAPLPWLLAAAGRRGVAAGTASADVRATGRLAAPTVEGEARLEKARISGFEPGDASVRFRWSGAEVQIARAEVVAAGGNVVAQGKVRIGKTVALEGEARLDGTELGDVLARFGLPGAWVSTRVRGDVKAAGTAWPLALKGTAALELADFRVLERAWDHPAPGEVPILEFRRGRLDTRIAAGPDGVRLEDARVEVGRETLTAQARLHFEDARGFAVEFAGGVDLGELGHVAGVPMGGRAVMVGNLGAEPYGNPHIQATVRARDFRFLRLDLGEAGAEVSAAGGKSFSLQVAAVDGRRGETRYGGQIGVDLGHSPVRLSGGRFEARGRLRDLFEGAMPWLPAARVVRDALDASVQAEASLDGPVDAVASEFTARLGPGELLGRPFDAGDVTGRIEEGRRAVFDRAELRRGAAGRARASGWVDLAAPNLWELDIAAAGMPLEVLGLPGERWGGTASGQAQLSGSFEHPLVRFFGNGDGVAVLGVPIGTVQLGGALKGRVLTLTGSTEGARFVGQARTDGDMPFEARAELDVEDVTRFLPGGPPAGLRARARGEAHAKGLLADVTAAEAEVSLADLQVGYADFRVQNRGPVQIATGGRRVEVRSLTLVGANTELAVAGARERDGRLSLSAEGSLDLRLLGGLLPGVTRPHGRLQVEAHVSGTTAEPLLVGSGHLKEAGFQIRDLPVTFAAMGGDLAFSQNRIVFDHLPATVNGGRAELDGELELQRFFPARVRVTARLDEVPVRIPSNLPSVVSGQLAATGTWDSMLLSGKLDVLRALYVERVDLEKSLLEWKRRAAAPRAYDKSGEWLRFDVQLVLGGDIRIENDLVRGGVRGELALTGTLGSLGLLGSVAMTPGSVATFRGHDFLLSHAVVDLTERNRIRPQMDVHGEAQVRDYQILMHSYGTFDDPQLQLTSVPSLTQEDIITLLSMGITSRDTAFTGGVGGAAWAAAGQALFSAAGLDEQVKRFLPRDWVLKDFTLRITSGYSEGSGQVVPKAEFETKLDFTKAPALAEVLKALRLSNLTRDVRLRYQAPVAGGNQAKGQRVQLESRFTQRSSLQFQWDNENPDTTSGGDYGADLRFRLEWED